ncbi:hypothetical protein [Nostoc sp. KVJ20]|uniref:hypothetical protein n=1 Tax=Nostoc sp. KVJ20 TaxID=457944 RepID=UPI00114CBA8B|nr:hypothetical protein [Nostoc sp. KVJ20]
MHHQIYDLVVVLNPVIQTRLENTRSKRSHAHAVRVSVSEREGFTLRYPPVIQNTQLPDFSFVRNPG